MTNVLLLTIDCLRADRLGYAGYRRQLSPNIDSLAERAAVFNQAFASGPRTAESFPAILASTYPMAIGGKWRLPESLRMLAEVLSEAGYLSGAFHSNPFLSTAQGYPRGFKTFWDSMERTPLTSKVGARLMPRLNPQSKLYRSLRRLARRFESGVGVSHYVRAGEITNKAIQWIAGATSPFFLWLHYMDLHYPFSPPEAYLRKIRPQGISKRRQSRALVRSLEDPASTSAEDRQVLVDLYDAGLNYLDEQIGVLLNTLSNLPIGKDTLLIITADHGEEFLEHGDFGHGAMVHKAQNGKARIKLYDELLQVPLLLHHPKLKHLGKQIPALVSLVDIPPTVVDLLGLPKVTSWQGFSLAPLLRGEVQSLSEREGVFSEYALRDADVHYPIVAYRTQGWKYIHDGAFGQHQLYNLEQDPGELQDLYQPEHPALPPIQQRVEEHLSLMPTGRVPLVETQMDPEMVERLKSLGYLE